YQVLKVIDVAVQVLPLSKLQSLEDARELLAATAWSADSDLSRISGDIAKRVMDEERALFAEYVRGISEEELATVVPVRTRFGGPVSDAGEEYSSWLEALIVCEMNDAGATIRDVILETLEIAEATYSELIPGVCLIRLESANDYEPLRKLLED